MSSKNAKRHTRLAGTGCALVLGVIVLPVILSHAHAAFYKCIGPDGSTTYNDTPCAVDESTHVLSKSARELSVLDCRIAHNFAVDVVARMRRNDSALDVFNIYGGVQALSGGAQNLINNVFIFKDNPQVSVQRIVDLTLQRCQAGLLGKGLERCDAFPADFIARSGGCSRARESHQNAPVKQAPLTRIPGHAATSRLTSATPPIGAANATTDNVTTDNVTTDNATTDNATTDDVTTDNVTTDNATTNTHTDSVNRPPVDADDLPYL